MWAIGGAVVVGGVFWALRCRKRASETGNPRISDLVIYPIKSCGGTSVPEAVVTPRGFLHDRRWMVVRADDGDMVTQRKTPRMALIKPKLDSGLVLEAAGTPSLHVPILKANKGVIRDVKVWGEGWKAVDQGDAAAEWLTRFLCMKGPDGSEVAVRLVFQDDSETCKRDITAKWKSEKPVDMPVSEVVSFADGQPFLIATTESLADLNKRIRSNGNQPVPMNRFRPNIVVTGCSSPWEEDNWYNLTIGNVGFVGFSRCTRCVLTTTDQTTAEQAGLDGEPLNTLRSFRRAGKSNVIFGTNLVPSLKADDVGVVRVGDPLVVNASASLGPI